jgi:cytochrome c-type biogenesis protein CcmH/NrfG
VLLVCAMSAAAAPRAADTTWTRLASEHFLFVGDAGDREIRRIAVRLEQFRAVAGRLLGGDVDSPVPTLVVVFQDDRSLTPFKPSFQGRPVQVAGYFVAMEDGNYIAVNAAQEREAYGVIFHEYAHFLTANANGAVPVWVNEGLAALYETVDMADGGTTATLGRPGAQTLRVLQTARPIPLEDLVSVTRDSPLYNEGDRRGMFYAESWALVHYLTFGSPARAGQLKEYVAAVAQGTPSPAAFRQAFGDTAALEHELHAYMQAANYRVVRVDVGDHARPVIARAEAIADSDAAGYLGDLLARLNREEDARAYLRKTLAASPEAARPMAALGLLELRASNEGLAFALLEKAAALAPDSAFVQGAYGRALARRADRGGADEDTLYAKARIALGRAMQLEPDNVSLVVTLAEVEMGSDADPARGVALMKQAVAASPGREEYRLMLGQALALNGEYRQASDLLGLLAARASRTDVREAAQRTLGRVNAAMAR